VVAAGRGRGAAVILRETPLSGAFLVELEPARDERGFFARSFCSEVFARHGLVDRFAQANVSWNARRGTLRGMHWQAAPHAEAKLVRCTAGALYDVIVDLRDGSPTCRRWHGVTLNAANRHALYVPEGFAHGFLTLADETEVLYEMSTPHAPEAARGLRWDDAAIGIRWPEAPRILSPRDAGYPDLPPTAGPGGRPPEGGR